MNAAETGVAETDTGVPGCHFAPGLMWPGHHLLATAASTTTHTLRYADQKKNGVPDKAMMTVVLADLIDWTIEYVSKTVDEIWTEQQLSKTGSRKSTTIPYTPPISPAWSASSAFQLSAVQ